MYMKAMTTVNGEAVLYLVRGLYWRQFRGFKSPAKLSFRGLEICLDLNPLPKHELSFQGIKPRRATEIVHCLHSRVSLRGLQNIPRKNNK